MENKSKVSHGVQVTSQVRGKMRGYEYCMCGLDERQLAWATE